MIKKLRNSLALLFFLSSWININAQNILSGIKYQLGAGAYLSGKTPFWMKANQYGLVPLEGPFITVQGRVAKEYDSTKKEFQKIKKFGLGYGAQLAVNAGKQSQILLPETYVKLRYGSFEFYAGRRKEIVGLIDTTLSAGSYIWSGNALPMPKVQIAIPNYTSIIGKGLISIKGAYAHGWFGKQIYTEGYYLHQKWLYGKIGRDSWKVNFYGGINHQVQWGGYSETLKDNTYSSRNGYFSADSFVYLNVVLPISWKIPANKYNGYEIENRFGNHLGSFDLGINIKTCFADISFYRQTPYEDGQMPEVFLSMDGNYSLSIKMLNEKFLSKISLGYLDTRRQAGELSNFARFLGKKETHPGEVQGYFNHGQYLEGWSYKNDGLGTPLVFSYSNISNKSPGQQYIFFTRDNRIQSYYFLCVGRIEKYTYKFQNSYTYSMGRFGLPREPSLKQYSCILSVTTPFKPQNFDSKIDIAFDRGKIYGNNFGISFFIVKKW